MAKHSKSRGVLKPRGKLMLAAEIVLLAMEVLFMVLVIMVGVLPAKYLAAIIAVFVVIDAAVILLQSRRDLVKRLGGLAVSLVMLCVLLMGCWYMQSTYSAFAKITNIGTQYDEYDVIVLDSAPYEQVEDIKGKKVFVAKANLKTYEEAQGKLKNTVDIKLKELDDIGDVGAKLVEDDGTEHDNVIFISDASYEFLCDNNEDYKKKTRVLHRIEIESREDNESGKLNVTQDPFNIYISGIDSWGDIEEHKTRSDVNMIVTVNPKTRQVLLTSIPRDAYVPLHSFGKLDKLTHAGIYRNGIDETVETVEDWMGIDLNYYFRVNFGVVHRLVNAIGGIDVYSDYAFHTSIKDYSYEKGWNHLEGKEALYFARERKTFKDNDQQRIKNQQKVVKAIIKKCTSSKVILAGYTDILDAIKHHMQTDMPQKDMSKLIKMQLGDMDKEWTINSISVTGEMQHQMPVASMTMLVDVCVMDEDSVDRAKDLIQQVMYPPEDKPVEIKDDKSKNGLKDSSEQIKPEQKEDAMEQNGQ